ncbi:MAG: threonine--tRNA ligase [Gemmatimonadetes bacterium]|nr:threonine--tRNA ligase [Gemmatimonadota bacterium]NNM05080.1 threonine--tRNA ligase [Gemmatimonadota bacterium]
MINVTLPDGTVLELPKGSGAGAVAEAIGPGLAKAALGAEIDGVLVGLHEPIEKDVKIRIITSRDPEALDLLRHSAAHVLATAVRELVPGAGIGFGPAIDEGFYYDFEVPEPFTPEDLESIEKKMGEVVEADYSFERQKVTKPEARDLFSDDALKLERLEEFTDDEVITVYRDGPFLDLCRGPHVPSTGRLKHYKLLSAAGAYWRGDESRQMLQRIYGTAFFEKKDLKKYLLRLEEAKKRDHRVLGKQLDLFSTDQRVGSGLILWHPKGAVIRNEVEKYEQELILRHGYVLVYTPHIAAERLFEISGHLENFKENMFGAMEVEGARYRPKPMNCPGHIAIYQSDQRSYRDLPIRMAEFGTVYRYERSGVLHGMLRVRGFTQDDAHVFCTPSQVPEEIGRLLDLVDEMLTTFGYPYTIDLATRPEKALGSEEEWEGAQKVLADVLSERGKEYNLDVGGGAFYGPKLDFKLIDAIGRQWQGPTVQLDFNLPDRFEMEYVGEDNEPHRPVMLHRVLVGSMERFVGGLIEHYAGNFPLWLAPEQVRVLPVSEQWAESAEDMVRMLTDAGLRASMYDRETLGYRIRDAELQKVPYMAVVGEREAEAGTVAVRKRGAGKKQEVMDRRAFVEAVGEEVRTRALDRADEDGARD